MDAPSESTSELAGLLRRVPQFHALDAELLARVAGVGIGAFADCVDPRHPEPGVPEVIAEAVRPLGVPFVTDLPFGHVRANTPWPVGGRATIDGQSGELSLLEPGVQAAA